MHNIRMPFYIASNKTKETHTKVTSQFSASWKDTEREISSLLRLHFVCIHTTYHTK